jgi:Kef-type K+ transport system membrane component KefB
MMASTKEFPTTVKELVELLPVEVFQTSSKKALKSLGLSVVCVVLGVLLLANVPWFLLPIGWLFLGTSITGVSTGIFSKFSHTVEHTKTYLSRVLSL